MKRNRKKKNREQRVISLWTYPQAKKSLPYLRSITGSLREHWLEAQRLNVQGKHMDRKPGRLDRTRILAREQVGDEKTRAEDRFGEALQELMGIDVYLLDPVQGTACIPFRKEENLAWFIFDLFDSDDLKTWRFHEDPIDMRRPIAEVLTGGDANPAAEKSA